ncbi:hypothetical protein [Flagellimonas meridianipacifica]|uniref:Uncharacterized protein n=1 Tax=Flagellimonas meridianipacifica TaxID=1080225 RepID=A0A2T0MIL2_9FLAO|nr:hypothetical protein [Allomuricauda pacifica]PRX57424.1 hypothetical protein CLV81_1428 [Allomuricauda pacifica]
MKILGIDKVILIGHSLVLFTGCGITEIDPPKELYFDIYQNSTNKDLFILLKNSNMEDINSLLLTAGEEGALKNSEVAFVGGDDPVQEYIGDLISSDFIIELYIDNGLVKTWTPADTAIKSPFNRNSWQVQKPTLLQSGLERGRIFFTLENEDIEN